MNPFAWLKRLMPRSLFGRALIMIVAPVVLAQVIAAAVFFDRHLEIVTRRLTRSVAGDIAYLASTLRQFGPDQVAYELLEMAKLHMNLNAEYLPGEMVRPEETMPTSDPLEQLKVDTLRQYITGIMSVRRIADGEAYVIRTQVGDGALSVVVPANRFTSATAHIVALWTVGSSLALLAVAVIFLRNQVRPIRQLSHAAQRFGHGEDIAYRPAGATEVRAAGAAFLQMRERIQRQIRQRTEMLAGVSHDLRTPLTRMKLSLAMLPESPEVEEIAADVDEMEKMVDGYLSFARGAQSEPVVDCDVASLLRDVVEDACRHGGDVKLSTEGDLNLRLRPGTLRRCVANLLDNARRHARHAVVSASREPNRLRIVIDDDGPGIPAERRDDVFRPFVRLEASRNAETGGVGLGLAIARDAIRGHGGDIELDESPQGGLRAVVWLPA
ncbi:MAG: ATP-binding protein [Alphaproteobacteria bacterium]